MQTIQGHHGGLIKAWVDGVEFEESAQRQVHNLAAMPFIHKHVAIMPDCHAGIGATVGSVFATRGAVIPAAVGVDIGCGMAAIRTSLTASDLPDSLHDLRCNIERTVPHGGLGPSSGWGGKPGGIPNSVKSRWNTLEPRFKNLCERYPALENENHLIHLGSLGGGNHFVEVCLDTEQRVWVMLHSGSRGIGNKIGRMFTESAREMLGKRIGHHYVPDKDLAWFEEGEQQFDDYIEAMLWAQDFAAENRKAMMERTLNVMRTHFPGFTTDKHAVNCHHNFAQKERHFDADVWVARKGAVEATQGKLGIIPGSMGAKSFIVRGLGNPESFNSCSHGAGRRMSRGAAKKTFSLQDHEIATAGVECRKDAGVIDETPGCYKDIDAVMAAQSDLVEIVATLKQVLCVKG
jgi:tRNA-splicing ligase RtcB